MSHNLSDDALRKLNHADWLAQFALTLHDTRIKRGQLVTPFLLGAVSRLQMAADYIRLLEADAERVTLYPPAGDSMGFDPNEREPPLATMFIGEIRPETDLPGGRGWEPYDEAKHDAAKARGEQVHVNVRAGWRRFNDG
jgi:hypothetical protein